MNQLNIIFEDNHLLVVNKEAEVVSQGALPGQTSLIDLAKAYLKKKYSKPGNVYLGVVSRLDSQVTGVIVLAKTSKAAARLTQQFQNSEVTKTYWALVDDRLGKDEALLQDYLLKNDAAKKMQVVSENTAGAKLAKLNYQRRTRLESGLSLVEVALLTGRKHQIRVQFASRDCPIAGDRKYGSSHRFPKGIALHSRTLELRHPTQKETMTFEADVPDYWPMIN